MTTGHFLIGDSHLTVPEPQILNIDISSNRYKRMLKQTQQFWQLWKRDYLHSLQHRQKWLKERFNLKIGDIVLIKEDKLAPYKWMMGRIIHTYPGPDNKVRVCDINTKIGSVRRPIIKLAPLPVDEHYSINSILPPQQSINFIQGFQFLKDIVTKNLVYVEAHQPMRQNQKKHLSTSSLKATPTAVNQLFWTFLKILMMSKSYTNP